MAKPIELTDANFDNEVGSGFTLVDFWAPWCGPCRMVGPVVEQLADDYAGRVKVAKLNTDEQQMTAMKFRVMSIPTLILFKDGQPVEVAVGAQRKEAYASKIDKHLVAHTA